MAKGQMRSNREVRKPKKASEPKTAPAASATASVLAKAGKVGGRPGRK